MTGVGQPMKRETGGIPVRARHCKEIISDTDNYPATGNGKASEP